MISDRDYKEIINFMKKEIINKQYTSALIFDAGFSVSGIYNNKSFSYSNAYEVTTKEDLYGKTNEFIINIINNNKH